uniref:Trypsin n=1 Tax=Euphausia superba TaxID=6819 RepID=A0A1D8QLQ0_EUPSU|nr:trypsin [Euphausia superba]
MTVNRLLMMILYGSVCLCYLSHVTSATRRTRIKSKHQTDQNDSDITTNIAVKSHRGLGDSILKSILSSKRNVRLNSRLSARRLTKRKGGNKRRHKKHRRNQMRSKKNDKVTLSVGSSSMEVSVAGYNVGDSGLYSSWSPWSHCTRHCRQRRQKACKSKHICGTSLLKEERSCSSGRCNKGKPFHVIRREDIGRYNAQDDVRVLLNFNSMFYTGWGRWSPCSRSCLTRRYRSCKYGSFCGGSVVHEEAYCYTTGSLCEQWYKRNKQSSEQPSEQPQQLHILSLNDNNQHHTLNKDKNGRSTEKDDKNAYSMIVYEKETTPATTTQPAFSNYFKASTLSTGLQGATKTHLPSSISPYSGYGTSDAPKSNHKCGISTKNLSLKIIGGQEAIKGKWPWQVVILNRYKEAFCGGTLVAPRWVLTAAHCVRKKLFVRIGEHDLAIPEGTEQEFKVVEAVIHPKYDSTTVDNDVALLKLPVALKPGNSPASPACLPEQGSSLPVGSACTIIGWGKERDTHIFGTDILHEAQVPVISAQSCRQVYKDYFITNNMFCAGFKKGRIDSCAGDSGGPLLCQRQGRWFIYGITSFGEGCGKRGKFGIYSRVSNYYKWIQDVIKDHYRSSNS